MLLIHGCADKTVPVEQSQELYDRLQATGVPAQLLLLPDVDHSFIGKTPADTQKMSRGVGTRVRLHRYDNRFEAGTSADET
jgi:dipeptidyl aminopeptidase/acylaminoacyl peptidase